MPPRLGGVIVTGMSPPLGGVGHVRVSSAGRGYWHLNVSPAGRDLAVLECCLRWEGLAMLPLLGGGGYA